MKILLIMSIASTVSFGVNSIAKDELKIRYDHVSQKTISFLKKELSVITSSKAVEVKSATIYAVESNPVVYKKVTTEKSKTPEFRGIKKQPCDTIKIEIHDTITKKDTVYSPHSIGVKTDTVHSKHIEKK